jgi:hypothetical protein
MFPDATHWLQHEEHESVSRTLAEFFSRTGAIKPEKNGKQIRHRF